ncbi:hypothetical protein KSS87_013646 [Heliosperma pusillum]|nr:hypothetical protein KSS87_013646 [Heliosperma pusillum]
MELELGLSLSNCTFHKIPSLEELDLIGYVNCEGNQDYYGDNLSSLLSCGKSSVNDGDYDQEIRNYDDNENGLCRKKRRNESDEVVGWPPINTYRKKQQNDTHQQPHHPGRGIGNCQAAENGGKDRVDDYKLTYQDEEGDWLLAGDVPWRTFIQSVQRLKMLRRDD